MAMAPSVKALLFDIGGVVVQSPLAAISAYERDVGIPSGYINSAIAAAAPNGAFQRLERGEMALDDRFFEHFGRDVRNRDVWERIVAAGRANAPHNNDNDNDNDNDNNNDNNNSDMNGTPKAENRPQELDLFAQATARIDARALFWTMMRAARHPDPHVYPALRRLVALGRARAASSCAAERRAAFVVGALTNAVVFPAGVRDERGAPFDAAMVLSSSSSSDTTRTVPIPPLFDAFLHSAHLGLRKPDPRAYALALRRLEAVLRDRGVLAPAAAALRPDEVLFLDDIGANLKAARAVGFRTCKVELGRTSEAVRVLERAVGARLLGGDGEGGGERERERGGEGKEQEEGRVARGWKL